MDKREFLIVFRETLRERVIDITIDEIAQQLDFYTEMIDDRIEDGMTEEEAVASLGRIGSLVESFIFERQSGGEETYRDHVQKNELSRGESEKKEDEPTKEKKFKTWMTVLLILGFPVWGSLLIAAAAIVISIYAVLFSVCVSSWAVSVALAACLPMGLISAVIELIEGYGTPALFAFGCALLGAGLSVFAFYGTWLLTKYLWLMQRTLFARIFKRRKKA